MIILSVPAFHDYSSQIYPPTPCYHPPSHSPVPLAHQASFSPLAEPPDPPAPSAPPSPQHGMVYTVCDQFKGSPSPLLPWGICHNIAVQCNVVQYSEV